VGANPVNTPDYDALLEMGGCEVWGVEPEAGDNVRNRQQFKELVDYAHSLHLKFLADGDEFTYHPGWLARLGVDLRPENPDFWEALQAKYRSLFQALPGLDGVVIRTGELTRVHGRYLAYDVMHEPEDSPWGLAQRYRTFVQKLHDVVVGEYGKLYFHRTWVTNTTEQHSDPEVFRAIFTDAVPTENLYLSPYITKADRWLYQPVNPTFNQTPHHMVALLAALEYHGHQGVDLFPTYPGPYFCSAMHAIRSAEPDNLRGVHFGGPAGPGWSTWHVTPYTAFRLAWNPAEQPETIAHDIAAMAFGPEAAGAVGTLLMQSQEAYTRGLYVKPVAELISGNTLLHLRLTTFPVQGFPAIDKGKAHIEWLRTTIYEPSLGRIDEAVAELDAGLASAETMHAQGVAARGLIRDKAKAQALVDSLTLMRALIRATGGYIKLAYAYFGYWDDPSADNRARLAQRFEALEDAVDDFKAAPGYQYKLFGIDALMANARALLDDGTRARAALDQALDGAAIETAVAEQQAAHAAMLEARAADAVPVLRWEGRVDGKDIFHITGADLTIEHIAADPIHSESAEWVNPLPQQPVTVLVRTREARDMGPFVLEQPTAANGYTAKLYLFDTPGGYGFWQFDVYYLPEPPDALGLAIPWQDE